MKRSFIGVILVVLFFTLCGCSSSYTVKKGGTDFTVDTRQNTISDGTNIYQYTISGSNNSYNINITYPNGSSFYWNGSTSGGAGGWSDNYDSKYYTDGGILCDILIEREEKLSGPSYGWIVIPLLIIGIFQTFFPYKAWYLWIGWRYKNLQPSDISLEISRAVGIFCLVIALIILIIRIYTVVFYS